MHQFHQYSSFSMKSALAVITIALCCCAILAQQPQASQASEVPQSSLASQAPQTSQAPQSSQAPQEPTYLPPQNPTAPQGPVPISDEPHHRLVLQNDFTHVYNVMVPPLDATLLHQHDLSYLYVTLGP